MKNDALEKTDQKFFFNVNVFDEAVVEADPNLVLAYNERDLDKAKIKAVEDGKVLGNKEAQDSIQKQTALVLQQIQNSFTLLFAGEDDREKTFEREVVTLTTGIFEKLFPLYHEKFGLAEIEESVKHMLQKHRDHKKIVLQVAPELEQPVEKLLSESGLDNVEVQPSPSIKGQTCILGWKDGGAEIKDTALLSEEIRTMLKQLLEEKPAKGHDKPKGESL